MSSGNDGVGVGGGFFLAKEVGFLLSLSLFLFFPLLVDRRIAGPAFLRLLHLFFDLVGEL